MTLNIIEGNRLDLEFPDESFTCVYSYNSSVHLLKKDTARVYQLHLGASQADVSG